jgi:hypothetical protein
MTQNSRTIVRTTRVLLGIAAAGVLTAGTVLSPVAASAAPSTRSAFVAPLDTTVSFEADVTGTVPGSNLLCTSHWKGEVVQAGLFGNDYSQVEWTSNPCGARIQERSRCDTQLVDSWVTSGEVRATNLWDRSNCSSVSSIGQAQVHFNFGGGWSSYQKFWPTN